MTNETKPIVTKWPFGGKTRVKVPETRWITEGNHTYPTGGWREKTFNSKPLSLEGLCPDNMDNVEFYDGGEGNGLVIVARYPNKASSRDTGYSEISVGNLAIYHMDENTGLVKCLLLNPRASESEYARNRMFGRSGTAHSSHQDYVPIEITPEKVVLGYSTGGVDNTDCLHGPTSLGNFQDVLEISLKDSNLPIVEDDRYFKVFQKEQAERMKAYRN